jgi:hypothetical protein
MNRHLIPSLALGWAGSFASWLTVAHPVLSLLATILAALASLYAILVSWRTAQLRRLEIDRTVQELCDHCRAGTPPPECPLPPAQRPVGCPMKP